MLIVFEAHATTLYNETGLASGWNDIELSVTGKKQAKDMGKRYRLEDFDAVFCSDLQRAYHTAQLAFPTIDSQKLFLDWRLRECDYGDLTGTDKTKVGADKINHVDTPFPNGESYSQAMKRMRSFIDDLRTHTEFQKVLIVGSRATHFGLDIWIDGKKLEDLLTKKMVWQPGWTYELSQDKESVHVCSVVLKKDDKYLLVQEKKSAAYKKWNLPGGRVDEGETLEQTAIREASEETGYKVEIVKQLFIHHTTIDQPVLHAYVAEIIGGKLQYPADEILDARWFSSDEIFAMVPELRNPEYVIGAIKAFKVQ